MSASPHDINLDPAIEGKLLAWLAVALLIVAFMAGAAIQNNSRQAESAAWVNHTYAFVLETDAILSALRAAEAAQRTHLLTGDEGAKSLTTERLAEVAEHLNVARTLAFKNPDQQKRLENLTALLQKQIDWNREAIQMRAQDPAAAAGIFTNAQVRANMVEIQKQVAAGKEGENALLLQREQKLQRHTRRTEQILYSGAALNLGLLGFAFYVVRRDLNLRRRAAAALQAANESLEIKVKERTAELATANEKLQIENLEQKWGQAALQRLVRHHELILNSIREGIFVISRNGHIISSNAAAAKLAGVEPAQLAGKPIQQLIVDPAGPAPKWDDHFLAAVVRQGKSFDGKDAVLKNTPRGDRRVRVACQPARDQENSTGAVVTVIPND